MIQKMNIQKTQCAYRDGNFGVFSKSDIELIDDTVIINIENPSSCLRFNVVDIRRVQTLSPCLYLWVDSKVYTISFDLEVIGQDQSKLTLLQKLRLANLPAPATALAAARQVTDLAVNYVEHSSDINMWKDYLVARGVNQKRLKSITGTLTIMFFSAMLLFLIVVILQNTVFKNSA